MVLRPDQKRDVALIVSYIRRNNNVDYVAPPGYGKTLVALKTVEELGIERAIFIAPTVNLAAQIAYQYSTVDEKAVEPQIKPKNVIPVTNIAVLAGKRHFHCPVFNTSADKAQCNLYSLQDRLVRFPCFMGPTKSPYLATLASYITQSNSQAYISAPRGDVLCQHSRQFIYVPEARVVAMTPEMYISLAIRDILPKHGLLILDESHSTAPRLFESKVELPYKLVPRECREGDLVDQLDCAVEGQQESEELVQYAKLRKFATHVECVKEGKVVRCRGLNYNLVPSDVRILLLGVPPHMPRSLASRYKLLPLARVSASAQLKPLELALHPKALSVSTLRKPLYEEYHKLLQDVAVAAIAEKKEDEDLLLIKHSVVIWFQDGLAEELVKQKGGIVVTSKGAEGLDVLKARVVITRAPYPHKDAVDELFEWETVRVLINAVYRGSRESGYTGTVYTMDRKVVELLKKYDVPFQLRDKWYKYVFICQDGEYEAEIDQLSEHLAKAADCRVVAVEK